jgi:hypothetical protein
MFLGFTHKLFVERSRDENSNGDTYASTHLGFTHKLFVERSRDENSNGDTYASTHLDFARRALFVVERKCYI